ncbi:MAG: MASE3 domain-containing protein [Deltaproteobacteria bacterium]|nr:MASE3 domain-containing protein [Deltaproteobacteria bacterium]
MNEPSGRFGTYVHFMIWVLALVGFYLTSRYSLALFHGIAGIFSVVIAAGVFAVAWNSRGFLENNYLLFLGIAYLFVGALDLLHTLAYGGMTVFPGFGPDLPVQLGFAARGLESVSLCLAPLCLGRRLKPYVVFAGYVLVFAVITLMIFVWPIFPLRQAAGPGLTALKQTADCLPGIILLGALALLWRRREEFDPKVLRLLMAAIALAAASELARTVFAGASDQSGVLAQLLKILSLFLIYQALIETGIRRPYNLLFRNLRLGEAMVRQERDFADSLMETAQVMVLVLDRQGRVVRLNPAGERLTGYSLAQVQGRLFWEVFPAPEAVDTMKEAFYHLTAGEVHQAEEIDWVAQDGARRLIAWSATAHMGEDGLLSHVIGTGIDITDRRGAEIRLQRLQAELAGQVQGDKAPTGELEVIKGELDRVTAAVSRDIRSPLRWISGFCQALEVASAHRLDFRGRRYLRRLRRMIRQTGELTEALLEHARLAGAAMEWQEIDLSDQAHTIAAALQRTAPGRRVEFIIGTNLRAEGDPAMLRWLLSNLLGNAWKFTETVPRGKIEFEALPTTDGTRGFLVRDNRAGLAPNRGHGWFRTFHRLHAYRDFSSPDPGLATVKRIIQRHGGRVWAEIDLRQGATFYFTLPPIGPGSTAKPSGGDQPDSLTGSS